MQRLALMVVGGRFSQRSLGRLFVKRLMTLLIAFACVFVILPGVVVEVARGVSSKGSDTSPPTRCIVLGQVTVTVSDNSRKQFVCLPQKARARVDILRPNEGRWRAARTSSPALLAIQRVRLLPRGGERLVIRAGKLDGYAVFRVVLRRPDGSDVTKLVNIRVDS